MEKVDVNRGLNDAIDLLNMLEYLSSGVSTGRIHGSEAPWAGMAVTIRQSKNVLLDVRESLGRGEISATETSFRNQAQNFDTQRRESVSSPSLADRVKQISAAGSEGSRTRELVSNNYGGGNSDKAAANSGASKGN